MRFAVPICCLTAVWVLFCRPISAGEAKPGDLAKRPLRILWTTSRVVGFPDPPPPYRVERAYPSLALERPLAVGRFPNTSLMWVVTHEQGYGGPGRIHLFEDDPAADTTELFLERREIIYGLAFHPDFARNRLLYVGCNGRSDALETKATRILRFEVSREPPFRCDPDSAEVVIEWPSDGHNGGDLAFGAGGMLYVSTGDGTSDSDPKEHGQDLSTFNGCVLRIDVDRPSGDKRYSVPADNPFVNRPDARPEIWAYGLRNPWRITYDRQAGQLWAGNNGQDLWETAHLIHRGENYGWSVMEGSHPFQLERRRGPTPLVPPTIEHPHSEARSLTGGVVYRGTALPQLAGAYTYGDYSTGNIWGARHDGRRLTWHQRLARTTLQISGFGVNTRSDLLVVDHGGGLWRLVPRPPQADQLAFPRRLSATGIFTDTGNHQTHAGLISYSVNSPLWSDGATKLRFIGLPGDERVGFHAGGTWDFPDGTVLVKTFSLPIDDGNALAQRRVETRLLTRQEGEWHGYSYAWNDEQSDATLVPGEGRDRDYLVRPNESGVGKRQTWHFPSRSECMVCHSRAAKFVLGLSTPQMNRPHDYGDGVPVNQLLSLEQRGVFRHAAEEDSDGTTAEGFALPKPPESLPRLADPEEETEPLEDRVRAYLEANCANCHVNAGGGNSLMKLDSGGTLEKMRIVDVLPQHDRMGIHEARLVAPGDPARSVLLERMIRRARGQMPPLATSRVDERGVALIREWIASLEPAP